MSRDKSFRLNTQPDKYPKFDKKTVKEYGPVIKVLRTYVKKANEEKTKIKKIYKKEDSLDNKEKKLQNRKEEKIKKIKSKADDQIKNNRKKINELKKLKINKTNDHYYDLNEKIKMNKHILREEEDKHYDKEYELIDEYEKIDQALKKAIKEGKPFKSPYDFNF